MKKRAFNVDAEQVGRKLLLMRLSGQQFEGCSHLSRTLGHDGGQHRCDPLFEVKGKCLSISISTRGHEVMGHRSMIV